MNIRIIITIYLLTAATFASCSQQKVRLDSPGKRQVEGASASVEKKVKETQQTFESEGKPLTLPTEAQMTRALESMELERSQSTPIPPTTPKRRVFNEAVGATASLLIFFKQRILITTSNTDVNFQQAVQVQQRAQQTHGRRNSSSHHVATPPTTPRSNDQQQ